MDKDANQGPCIQVKRNDSMKGDDKSWTSIKGKVFRVASVIILPKNKRSSFPVVASRSAPISIKSKISSGPSLKLKLLKSSADDNDLKTSRQILRQDKATFAESDEDNNQQIKSDEPDHNDLHFSFLSKRRDLPFGIDEDASDDEQHYQDFYSCMPPPIFMFTITMIELGFFIYHTHQFLQHPKYGYIGKYSPAPLDSPFIYNPTLRHQVWRYFTYALVHSGYMHIINNIVVQLVLGILLEMVHEWWRVLTIYFAGVLAGSLATSISEPYNYLAGASAGVYALIAAHLSTVILNWSEMEYPWIRVLVFTAFAIHDAGTAVYFAYFVGEKTNVGYAAHLGGAVAGLLVGIHVLKNLKWKNWEKVLWYASVIICVILMLFAIIWNIVRTDLFP